MSGLVEAVQDALTDDLRGADWRGHPNPLAGHCYVASEALWHLHGRAHGYRPHHVKHEGTTHWYLVSRAGHVLDPTRGQFATRPPYAQGRCCGFLTQRPSRRARVVIARVRDCDHCEGGLLYETCACSACEYSGAHGRYIPCANCQPDV